MSRVRKPLTRTYADTDLHDRWWTVYFDPAQDAFNARLYRRVFTMLPGHEDALLLDAGCGRGVHARSCRTHVAHCVAVDLSAEVLMQTTKHIVQAEHTDQISLSCTALEDLSIRSESVDIVHCRGVLMHIPNWRKALGELCRVVKPGGAIILLESNHRSVEAGLVRLLRRWLGPRKSTLVDTAGGPEFWATIDGNPFVVRYTNIEAVIAEMATHDVRAFARIATEFWDLNRAPAGFLRRIAFWYNCVWGTLRLGPTLSAGNAILAVKAMPVRPDRHQLPPGRRDGEHPRSRAAA